MTAAILILCTPVVLAAAAVAVAVLIWGRRPTHNTDSIAAALAEHEKRKAERAARQEPAETPFDQQLTPEELSL